MALLSWTRFGVESPFDPRNKFVSSPLFSPAVLAAIRILIALYALCTIITVLVFTVQEGAGRSFLSYFTELSYIGLTAYYCAAAVQSFFYARYGRYLLRRWPRPLQALHVLLQSTITSFPFLVTIVYWALLSSPETFATTRSSWQNISVHALNSLFALIELLLTNAPPAPWLFIPVHILLLAAYLGVAYLTHAEQGFYPYSFLAPSSGPGILAAYILGIGAASIIVFTLARFAITLLREKLLDPFFFIFFDHSAGSSHGATNGGSEGQEGGGEALDEWETVDGPGVGGRPKREAGEGREGVPMRVVDSGVTVGDSHGEVV